MPPAYLLIEPVLRPLGFWNFVAEFVFEGNHAQPVGRGFAGERILVPLAPRAESSTTAAERVAFHARLGDRAHDRTIDAEFAVVAVDPLHGFGVADLLEPRGRVHPFQDGFEMLLKFVGCGSGPAEQNQCSND